MVVKKIIQICKKTKCIALHEDNLRETQWLGDLSSFYPLFGMPRFDEDSICRAYDITEKQAEKIRFFHNGLPGGISFADVEEGETVCEPLEITLNYMDTQVKPYMTSQGIKFMNQQYLEPVRDESKTHLEVYERHTETGTMYFAVKAGMELVAVVFPIAVISENFVKTLGNLYMRAKVMLESEENKC